MSPYTYKTTILSRMMKRKERKFHGKYTRTKE